MKSLSLINIHCAQICCSFGKTKFSSRCPTSLWRKQKWGCHGALELLLQVTDCFVPSSSSTWTLYPLEQTNFQQSCVNPTHSQTFTFLMSYCAFDESSVLDAILCTGKMMWCLCNILRKWCKLTLEWQMLEVHLVLNRTAKAKAANWASTFRDGWLYQNGES